MIPYLIHQIPVAISDAKVREMATALGITLVQDPEIGQGFVRVVVATKLSKDQILQVQAAVRAATLEAIGTVTEEA